MKSFNPSIEIELHLSRFEDENKEAEKIIELFGYYKISKVVLDQC